MNTFFAQTKKVSPKTNKTVKANYKKLTDSIFEKGDIIQPPEIVYTLSSCEVLYNYKDSVKLISQFLLRHPNLVIEIGCHTDSRGSAYYNTKLTECRSNSVRDIMIRDFSCPQGRVTARGYGEDKPLIADQEILKLRAPEEKENLHRKNRRTEIKILEVR